jgi:hypothetical protein
MARLGFGLLAISRFINSNPASAAARALFSQSSSKSGPRDAAQMLRIRLETYCADVRPEARYTHTIAQA